MAMDFPNSPSVNDTFTVGARTWKWSGSAWTLITGASAHAPTHAASGSDPLTLTQAQITGLVSALAAKIDKSSGTSFPGSPVLGQIFVNTATKCSYIYNGSAWDELTRPNRIEPLLLIGI